MNKNPYSANDTKLSDRPTDPMDPKSTVDKISKGAQAVTDRVETAIGDAALAGRRLEKTLVTEMNARPYVAVGVVAAAGLGLGMLLGPKYLKWAALIGGGYAITRMSRADAEQALAKLQEGVTKIANELSKHDA